MTQTANSSKVPIQQMTQVVSGRERAARILSSWEMLAWYSAHNNESIPQTRLRFQREMMGLKDDGDYDLQWEDEVAEDRDREERSKGKGRAKDSSRSSNADGSGHVKTSGSGGSKRKSSGRD